MDISNFVAHFEKLAEVNMYDAAEATDARRQWVEERLRHLGAMVENAKAREGKDEAEASEVEKQE